MKRTQGRGVLASQAVLLVRALDEAGSQGLDWREIADVLREIRTDYGFETNDEATRRTAYRWIDSLEATMLYETCEHPHHDVPMRLRRVVCPVSPTWCGGTRWCRL